METKAIICAINAAYYHTSYSANCLKSAYTGKQSLEVAEFTISTPPERIASELIAKNAELYLFSCYLWNIELTKKVCEIVKKVLNCEIVLGGSEVAYCKEKYCALSYIDAVCICEGEGVINELVDHFINKIELANIPGIAVQGKDSCEHISYDFSKRPFPYTINELKKSKDKLVYYETQRGCIYNCSYCISHIDKKMRYVSLSRVFDELSVFIACEVKLVKFIDRTFNSDSARAEEIIAYINTHNKITRFHFEVRAEILTDKLISLLKEAPNGTYQLEIGLQSTNEATLKAIGRNNNYEKFTKIFSELKACGKVHLHADLIALLPHETYESFKDGFNYLYSLHPDALQLGFLKVLSGTRMESQVKDYGIAYMSYPPYEALKSFSMSYSEAQMLKKIAKLTDLLYCSASFNLSIRLIEKMFDSPFEMFARLSELFEQNGFFNEFYPKAKLYEILLSLKDAPISLESALCFDYLENVDFNLPIGLRSYCKEITAQSAFALLEFISKSTALPGEFRMLSPKELKKICAIYCFEIDPIKEKCKEAIYLFIKTKKEEKNIAIRLNQIIKKHK